jgi:hypothetical protein
MKATTRIWLTLAVASIALIAIWGWWLLCGRIFMDGLGLTGDEQLPGAGLVGDSFGVINAVFSGLAMIGVLGSLMFQRVALTAQQGEIDRQQKQIKEGRTDQLKARFEQSFFELLSLARELRQKVEFRHSEELLQNFQGDRREGVHHADAAFEQLAVEFEFHLGKERPERKDVHYIGDLYETFVHPLGENSLGPYFRVLYTMLRRVSEAPYLDEAEKIAYGNLLRSQLTSPELYAIALNGASPVSGNFKEYLEEFRLFKYLPKPNVDVLKGFGRNYQSAYADKAFRGRSEQDV